MRLNKRVPISSLTVVRLQDGAVVAAHGGD
jgi:hypothetical protein